MHDGTYQATDPDGRRHPITFGGQPLTAFQPGWVPVGLQTGLPPFHLLELRRDDGPMRDAVWYLDQDFGFAGNALDRMQPWQVARLHEALIPLLAEIRQTSLLASTPAIADAAQRFSGINPRFVADLVRLIVALAPPQIVRAARFDQVVPAMAKAALRLSPQMLEQSLAPGRVDVRVVSPFTGTKLPVQEAFAFAEDRTRAWRCHDPVHDVTLYLLASADGAPALYVPAMDAVFTHQHGLSGARVLEGLLCHYALADGILVRPTRLDETESSDAEAAEAGDDSWLARAAAAETIDHATVLDDADHASRNGWLRRLLRPTG
ncbi:hypothetical protein [Lichenicoccus sp.]|uniref:hypothetical protein n=1 Tax=Lichenicoccus sp. TaxID=2781899 RepID=UPI003D0EB9CF